MKQILSLATLLALGIAATAAPITPTPRQQNEGGPVAFATSGATYRLTGAEAADADAVRILSERLTITPDGSIEIVIGAKGGSAVSAVDSKIPSVADGYYLSVSTDKVMIAGTDGAGQFYGAQSFLQLAAGAEVAETEVTDYPEIPIRGVIEGFYGNPWSHEARISMFEFMGRHKMNEYTYGPKNDPYHRGSWATPYPAAEGKLIT
ncbi:MAG: beta-N-acetylglucosaminidase domain-containing protein, partial [Muribaculaceae bacterium]|nr:beta-N-acetylglucosaminidase domain-containing protein [Muribaculaceae bacterium]